MSSPRTEAGRLPIRTRLVRELRRQAHRVNQIEKHGSRYGILYGIAAYGSWGFFPLYFKAVANVPPVEVLAHRALWSFVVLAVLVGVLGRWKELWRELHSRKLILMLTLSTLFIAANWLMFIYAVSSGQVLQASLGYFINPLVNVLLGVLFLRERLRTRQTLSIGLAVIGVLVLTAIVGEVPWVALTLALTFSLYALMRKLMPVDGLVSLTVETLIMAPLGLAYLGYLAAASSREPLTLGTRGPLDAQRADNDGAALVLRGGGTAAAAVHDGHPSIPLANPAIPAGGLGFRGAIFLGATAELRLHLGGGSDLCRGFLIRGPRVPGRGFGAGLMADAYLPPRSPFSTLPPSTLFSPSRGLPFSGGTSRMAAWAGRSRSCKKPWQKGEGSVEEDWV